jgi:hypothetical protein
MRLLARLRRRRHTSPPRRAERFLAAGVHQSHRFGHDYVGTEHVLLALAEDSNTPVGRALARLGLTGGVVRRDIECVIGTNIDPRRRAIDPEALATLGIDFDEVRRRVELTFGPGALERTRFRSLDPKGGGSWCIASRLEKALGIASTKAGEGPVRAEHVLVSLASVEDCIAARIMGEHGVTLVEVRKAVN